MTEYKIIGIDLAKTKFHIAVLDFDNKLILKKALHRDDVLSYCATTFSAGVTIAMEACGGCHFFGQQLEGLGFRVILLKPKDVKPYAKSKQKNDINDALAICKAALDPELKHVYLKTPREQTVAYLHKARQNAIQQRIQRSNSILTSLMEFGVIVKCSKSAFGKQAEAHIQQAFEEDSLPKAVFDQMMLDTIEITNLLKREALLDKEIRASNSQSETAGLLKTIPGIGLINASILSIQPMSSYADGREFSASLGLVPKQHTTGGEIKLGRITKQGNRYIRTMLIQAGRAILMRVGKENVPQNSLYDFAIKLKEKKGFNVACVAIANKLGRIAYACATKKQVYSSGL
ncbi:MAG: IS110 family transposase [Alphaproteobacteria bacterium]|nr:IS110 family transposase [Alphaproteobacteria bacterium]